MSEPEPRQSTGALMTFSVRISKRDKDTIEKAAKLRGWSVNKFLRDAAVERAAHIINASTVTRLELKGLARDVATQIFAERTCRGMDPRGKPTLVEAHQDLAEIDEALRAGIGPTNFVEVRPWQKPASFLDELKVAAHFAGTEFLNLILKECEDYTDRVMGPVEELVDPTSV